MTRATAALACALLALAAAPAEAKKKGKPKGLGPVITATATGPLAVTEGQVSSATAICPKGTRAFGGGFSAPFHAGPDTRIGVFESFRTGVRRWTASAVALTAGDGAVTTYAYCRRSVKAILDVAATAPLASGSGMQATATAVCPAKKRLIGGGFQSTHGSGTTSVAIPHDNLSLSPGSWTLRGVNNTNGAQTITAHAYCLGGIRRPTVLNTTMSAPNVAEFGSQAALTGSCPKPNKKKKKKRRKRLSAGGFSTPQFGVGTAIAVFTESRIEQAGWLNLARNADSTAGTLTLTSQGLCV
jgi:hypothetical protein